MERASGAVYLRWWKRNQPASQPVRMQDEASARAKILGRFPAVTFGRRVRTAVLVGIDVVLYAYDGPQESGKKPIAEILYPAEGSHLA